MRSSFSDRDRLFEEYLRDGISAVKTGQNKLAQSLLNRAIYLNNLDSRPYLWLSAATEDPGEQREYLERAVAIDPTDASARRGLALLTGKIDKSRLMEEGAGLDGVQREDEVEAQGLSFQCPQCGGRMSYALQEAQLTCEYCGHVQSGVREAITSQGVTSVADRAEQVLDFVLPTTRGHRWAEAQQHLRCGNCGALNVLPAGQKATQCSYCGANQFLESTEHLELVDPQVIALMRIDQDQAIKQARRWLAKGFFSPDNLLAASRGLQLRPAYYSCWTFDGTVEVRWSCEVAEGNGQTKQWVPMNGVETRFFNDVLVPGVKALEEGELKGIEPFDLMQVEEFKPEHLAGWTAILYDCSLSDASLLAREKVIRQLRPQLYSLIAIGREKRNLNLGSGSWSGMTFKHILLPLWTGTYQFQGKTYRLLVNGQTGKVDGVKPRDTLKLVFTALIAVSFLILLILLYWLLSGNQ